MQKVPSSLHTAAEAVLLTMLSAGKGIVEHSATTIICLRECVFAIGKATLPFFSVFR